MAKGSNGIKNKKSHSSKPYDISNSFVKKVTAGVSHLLPQTAWISKWFSPTCNEEEHEDDANSSNNLDSRSIDNNIEHAPPPKRARIPINTSFPSSSFQRSHVNDNVSTDTRRNSQEYSVQDTFVDGAIPGPSSRILPADFVSSTPTIPPSTHLLTNSERLNGDDRSVSSESTSGCSSLVPQVNRLNDSTHELPARRRSIEEKLSFTNHLQGPRSLRSPRSLFPGRDRTSSLRYNSTQRSRDPAFNVSAFWVPSSGLDRSTPASSRDSRDRVVTSPFYCGSTTYGGASAYRRRREAPFSPIESPQPRGVQVRPASNGTSDLGDTSGLSHTARKIFEALEQLSTPVLDAKRIPTPPLAGSSSKRRCPEVNESTRQKRGGTTPRAAWPPTSELSIPTIPDLMHLRRREKLQDSMEGARLIASTSRQNEPSGEYRLRSDEDTTPKQHSGKMRSKQVEEELAEAVHLPDVRLPITTMPTFNLDTVVPPKPKFSFSSSIVVVTEGIRTTSQGPAFVFSQPVSVLPNCISTPSVATNGQKMKEGFGGQFKGPVFGWECKTCLVHNKETDTSCVACTTQKSGLPPPKPKQDFGTQFKRSGWECGMCLVQNKEGDTVCIACTTQKPESLPPKPSQGFGEQFKPSGWECGMCLVRNKQENTTCVSCNTRKPDFTSVAAPAHQPTVEGKNDIPKSQCTSCGSKRPAVDCAGCNKAKPGTTPSSSQQKYWGCPVCFFNNSATVDQCSSCNAGRPGPSNAAAFKWSPEEQGFGEQFKPAPGMWSCSECLVSNPPDKDECLACEVPRPGSSSSSKGSLTFKVDIPPQASSFKFGIDKSAVSTSNGNISGFKFGETKLAPADVKFSFGIPPKAEEDSSKPDANFSFKTPDNTLVKARTVRKSPKVSPEKAKSTTTHTFGNSPENTSDKAIPATQFSFGKSQQNVLTTNAPAVDKANFSFRLSSENTSDNDKPGANFSFGKVSNSSSDKGKPALNLLFEKSPDGDANASSIFSKSALHKTGTKQPIKHVTFEDTSEGLQRAGNVPKSPISFPSPTGVAKVPSKRNASVTKHLASAVPVSSTGSMFSQSSAAVGPFDLGSSEGNAAKKPASRAKQTEIGFDSVTSSTVGKVQTSTSASPVFGTTTATSSVFTTPTTMTPGSVFGAFVAPTSGTAIFGGTTESSKATFASPAAVPTTSAPVFGAPVSNAEAAPKFDTSSSAASAFLVPVSTNANIATAFGSPATSTTSPSPFGGLPLTTKTPIMFGSPATTTVTTATFGASASTNKAPMVFQSPATTTATTPAFSVPATTTATTPAFGAPATTTVTAPAFSAPATTTATAPAFGAPALSGKPPLAFPSPSSTPNTFTAFGGPSSAPNFSFGGQKPSSGDEKPSSTQGSFMFGSTSMGATTPNFTFGSKQPGSIDTAKPLGFPAQGSSNAGFPFQSTTPQSGGFTFGSGTKTPGFGSTNTNFFGASPAAAGFGTANPGGFTSNPFSFGSSGSSNNNTNAAGGFQSGSTVFGFGGDQPGTNNAAPSFSFGTPTMATPTFNPNARPSYNFTGGETTPFTAGPSQTPARRIKKAIRRTPHQR